MGAAAFLALILLATKCESAIMPSVDSGPVMSIRRIGLNNCGVEVS